MAHTPAVNVTPRQGSEDDLNSLGYQSFEWHDCQEQRDNRCDGGNEEPYHVIGPERNGAHLANNRKAVTEISQ